METAFKKLFLIVLVLSKIITYAQSEKKLQLEGELFFRNINYGNQIYGGYKNPRDYTLDQFTNIKFSDLRSYGIGGAIAVGYKNWFLTIQASRINSSINVDMHNLVYDTSLAGGMDIIQHNGRYKFNSLETNFLIEKRFSLFYKLKFSVGLGASTSYMRSYIYENDIFQTIDKRFFPITSNTIISDYPKVNPFFQLGLHVPITEKLDLTIKYLNERMIGNIEVINKQNNTSYNSNFDYKTHCLTVGVRYNFLKEKKKEAE